MEGAEMNPFDDIRPVLRSEEDDIRKGVFSHALRTLHVTDLETKQRWCAAIHEATNKSGSAKRPRVAAHMGDEDDAAAKDDVAAAQWSTAEDAGAFVAAFMRSLLDRVVGGSLNSLSSSALRVLCLMLDITTNARGKDALYNTLANFYYTKCERLGKRVSKSTIVEQQAQQMASMLSQTSHREGRTRTTTTTTSAANTAATTPAPAASGAGSSKTTSVSSSSRAERTNTRAAKAPTTTTTRKTATVPITAAADEQMSSTSLEIETQAPLFARRGAEQHTSSPRQDSATESSQWTRIDLERKVASIVHLYDPVTAAIVVKKLAQIGFRDANAEEVVESILRSFHAKQHIFYDNGIAYVL